MIATATTTTFTTFTTFTHRVLAVAEQANLRPRMAVLNSRSLVVEVNQPGERGYFGEIVISRRSGRIVRAVLTAGNGAITRPRRYEGPREVARIIGAVRALHAVCPAA